MSLLQKLLILWTTHPEDWISKLAEQAQDRPCTCGAQKTDPAWLSFQLKEKILHGLMAVWISLVLLTAWVIPWYFYHRQ